MDFEIRKLTREDMQAYKSIRLLSLEDTPFAFAASVDEEKDKDDEFFHKRISDIFIMGCLHGNELVSTAGVHRMPGIKQKHKAVLWSVYTKQEFRNKGIGRKVLRKTLDCLPEDIERISLAVYVNNRPAIKIYEQAGFEYSGLEKKSLKWQNQYYDEMRMVKFLN